MRYPIALLLVIFTLNSCQYQHKKDFPPETVNWKTPHLFSAGTLTFSSADVKLQCNNCKCFEIRTPKGVTGLFIIGNGAFTMFNKVISDSFSAFMLRFHPSDYDKLIQLKDTSTIHDRAFYSMSLHMLSVIFRHCYHTGWQALIPLRGDYAIDFYSQTYGDILASFSKEKKIIYSFSDNEYLLK